MFSGKIMGEADSIGKVVTGEMGKGEGMMLGFAHEEAHEGWTVGERVVGLIRDDRLEKK